MEKAYDATGKTVSVIDELVRLSSQQMSVAQSDTYVHDEDAHDRVVELEAHVEQLRKVWDHEVHANEVLRTLLTQLRAKFNEAEAEYEQRIQKLESELEHVPQSGQIEELQRQVDKFRE